MESLNLKMNIKFGILHQNPLCSPDITDKVINEFKYRLSIPIKHNF
jgi:hypothetical protein